MERINNELKRKGTTLSTDPDLRRSQRPVHVKGKDFEDLGSPFAGEPKSAVDSGLKAKSNALGVMAAHNSGSDDEMLLRPNPPSSQGEGVMIEHQFHLYHKDYPPKTLPSFKKNKVSNADTGCALRQPATFFPAPRTPDSSASKPIQHTITSSSSQQAASCSRPTPRTTRAGTHKPTKEKDIASSSRTPTYARAKEDASSHHNSKSREYMPLTPEILNLDKDISKESRPRPRPRHKSAQDKSRTFQLFSPARGERDSEGDPPQSKICPFPTIPPLSDAANSQPSSKRKGKEKPQDNPIDALSPLSSQVDADDAQTKRSKAPGDFPVPSPLSSSITPSKSSLPHPVKKSKAPKAKNSQKATLRGKRRIIESQSEDESDAETPPSSFGRTVRPFPMETQLLESIGRSPGKRSSSDDGYRGMDPELFPEHKKRRQDPDELLAELLRSDGKYELDEEDMLILDSNVDPETLCPWCDEPLPPVPTHRLCDLISTARKSSWDDPRPSNRLGLGAPLGVFVAVCQRHRFESHHLPLAQERGWPMQIEWERVAPRVRALRPRLQEIIDDVDEDFLSGATRREDLDGAHEDDLKKWADRPRKGCVFWNDVAMSIRKKGSRQTAGVAGQWANFNKTQPGYYGELGYVIIHQTIYNLFPPASFVPDSTLPLTPVEFIQQILVPEAAVSLIMEDLHQSQEHAIVTLRESAEYGVAMFPDDHSEDATGVHEGERIIMERARARRRELEAEERMEEEMHKEMETRMSEKESEDSRRLRRRKQRKSYAESSSSRSDDDKPKRLKRSQRSKNTTCRPRSKRRDKHSDVDPITITDSDSSYPGPPKKRTASCTALSRAKSNTTLDDNEVVSAETTKLPPRPKPKRKKADPATFSGKGSQKKSDILSATDASDVDADPPALPSNQLALRDRNLSEDDLDCTGSVLDQGTGGVNIDVDETPKPRRYTRSVSRSSTNSDQVFPLQLAKDRGSRVSRAPSTSEWSYNLRSSSQSWHEDDEDGDIVMQPGPTQNDDNNAEDWDWLIDS